MIDCCTDKKAKTRALAQKKTVLTVMMLYCNKLICRIVDKDITIEEGTNIIRLFLRGIGTKVVVMT
jgi:hypothetical protein